jgi:hypothetical protein
MTRKLTDEQVKAIEALTEKGAIDSFKIEINKEVSILVQPRRLYSEPEKILNVVVLPMASNLPSNNFETADEAIAYAEHLLNQRYQWLPQNNGWIMSGEVYNFANGGANKVLELMHINDHFSWFAYWMEYGIPWFLVYDLEKLERGYPTPEQLSKGITIPADSPIWDAVKGV